VSSNLYIRRCQLCLTQSRNAEENRSVYCRASVISPALINAWFAAASPGDLFNTLYLYLSVVVYSVVIAFIAPPSMSTARTQLIACADLF